MNPARSPDSPFTPGLPDGSVYRLYLVTNPAVRRSLDTRPFGIRVRPIDFCAEHFSFRGRQYDTVQLLSFARLAHSNSPQDPGRLLPRWMIVDLMLMPSGLLLALATQDQLKEVARSLERRENPRAGYDDRNHAVVLRDLLKAARDRGYNGPLPAAGYAAIPTLVPGSWLGGSVWWSLVPGAQLGYSVRRIALATYKASREIGVMQFSNSPGLRAQRGFGKLQVTHPNLAVHPKPGTFVYEVDLTCLPADGRPLPAGRIPPGAIAVDPGSPAFEARLASIEADLKKRQRCFIASADRVDAEPVIYTQPPEAELAEEPAAGPASAGPGPAEPQPGAGKEDYPCFSKELAEGKYKPYIVANGNARAHLNLEPFGLKIGWIDFCEETFDDGKYKVPQLVTILTRAISLAYAESGLGAPKRAMVELALMPSAVLLLMADQERVAALARELDDELVIDQRKRRLIPLAEDDRNRLRNIHSLRELLELADKLRYEGPLPIAGYAAAPTPQPGRWVGWSLWSLVPGKQLGYAVKRIGLECYGVKRQSAVLQFSMGRGLDVITKFGIPRITAVDVRAHPSPSAFIYELDLANLPAGQAGLRTSRRRPRAQWELSPDSDELASQLRQMRYRLDRGTRYYLLPRPTAKTTSPKIPIHQRTCPADWLFAHALLLFKNARSAYSARRLARYTRVTRRRVRTY